MKLDYFLTVKSDEAAALESKKTYLLYLETTINV